MGSVGTIERIGGDVAVDFVNTLGGLPDDPDDEYLLGYADLLLWARDTGLLDGPRTSALVETADIHPQEADRAFAAALELRQALDAALRAHLGGPPLGPRPDLVLREAYGAAVAAAVLRHEGTTYRWSWDDAPTDLAAPVWPVAVAGIDLLRSGRLDRLGRCGHCRWLFLDSSRNHSRRWCSMGACGSVVKMRRYRARG